MLELGGKVTQESNGEVFGSITSTIGNLQSSPSDISGNGYQVGVSIRSDNCDEFRRLHILVFPIANNGNSNDFPEQIKEQCKAVIVEIGQRLLGVELEEYGPSEDETDLPSPSHNNALNGERDIRDEGNTKEFQNTAQPTELNRQIAPNADDLLAQKRRQELNVENDSKADLSNTKRLIRANPNVSRQERLDMIRNLRPIDPCIEK